MPMALRVCTSESAVVTSAPLARIAEATNSSGVLNFAR